MIQPTGEQFAWATTTTPAGVQVRVENPGLQMPLTFLLDDPAPLRNPMFFHRGFRGDVEVVPNAFLSAFADVAERWGIRGKFSVVPYPFGLGRIDRGMAGVSARDLEEFLTVVRERLTPLFDITPEMLTHWNALDLATERLLPLWEHEWSRRQTRASFTPYLARALEILNAVDLPANGITSPWNFGHGVEDEYVPAILAAQQAVNGLDLTWYVLDWDRGGRYAPPRVMHLDAAAGTAVVSVVSGDGFDFAWQTQDGTPARTDELISADGLGGRLVELAQAGGPLTFLSHWQSLFSNGSAAGLGALDEVAARLATHLGTAARWAPASEVARIAATAAALAVSEPADGSAPGTYHLALSAPFGCPAFTLSLEGLAVEPDGVRSVGVGGVPLTRQQSDGGGRGPLAAGAWTVRAGRVYACWDLQPGASTLTVAA